MRLLLVCFFPYFVVSYSYRAVLANRILEVSLVRKKGIYFAHSSRCGISNHHSFVQYYFILSHENLACYLVNGDLILTDFAGSRYF